MNDPVDAFHLPGLTDDEVDRWEVRDYRNGVRLRFPVLRPGAITALARRLTGPGSRIRGLPTGDIIAAIESAATRFSDPADPARITAERLLPAVTGYSVEMIRLVLDRATRDWSAPALRELLDREIPGAALERFVPERGTASRTKAVGPRLALHICSGNVPGVAVTSIVRSLLVRAPTIAKTAAGEPVLAALFADALCEAEPRLAGSLAVLHWPGGDSPVEDEAIAAADTIVVYGGEEVVRSVRRRAPATARIVEHGPRASVGLVGRAALVDAATARAMAARVAWAVAMFDQQGCVSPHVVWVERGATDVQEFAGFLAEALDALESELPRGTLDPAEAAAIREARTRAEFRAMEGDDIGLYEGEAARWTVIREADAAFEPSCLNRTIRVKPLDRLEDAPELIAPFRGLIQTAALEGAAERTTDIAMRLADAGATRITDFRKMPWPPPAWHHDGRGSLRELLTWIDLETE